jgi:imidazoleglycerol phosphate dehydratase HisB
MDDCLAQVAIDFGGRNWLVWDTEFKRDGGGKPTEMFCISLNPSQMVPKRISISKPRTKRTSQD